MATQVPLMNNGAIQLQQTGIMVPRTANLEAGNPRIGEAIQGVGNDLFRIAEEEQRANDARQLIEFEAEMTAAQERQQQFQLKVQDQDQWLPQWQKEAEGLQKKMQGLKVSRDTRLTLDRTMNRFTSGTMMSIREGAARQAKGRAIQAFDNRLASAKTPQEVDMAAGMMASTGILSPEDLEAKRIQATEQAKRSMAGDFASKVRMAREGNRGVELDAAAAQALNDGIITEQEFAEYKTEATKLEAIGTVREMAIADPVMAKAKLKTGAFPELTTEERMREEGIADGILRDYQQRETAQFADYIVNGGDAQKFKFQWNLSDARKAELLEAAKKPPQLTEAQAAIKRLELETLINGYSPEKDPDRLQMLRISAELDAYQKAVPYMGSDLGQQWGRKKGGGGDADNFTSMDIADHDSYIEKLYKPKMKELLDWDGNIKKGKEGEFRAMQAEATKLKKEYRSRIGTNPDPAKAKKTSQDILALPIADQVANYFDMIDNGPQSPLLPSPKAQPVPLNP